MFYKKKKIRNNASLWLSAINPPFNMDEPDVVALDDEILEYSLNGELSSEFIDEEIESKIKEI